jgi:ABC-2 type transport system ATP-binding protein
MRAIAGVQSLDNGELTVLGQKAGAATLRSRIGYMAQTPAIYGDLSVRQNVEYFAKILKAAAEQAAEQIAAVDLTGQQDQLVETLSGGQKARVSLAIALLGNPDVLILDEPTVGLDPVLRRELWRLFAALTKQGKTLIISSHVMDEAEHCDAILLMRDGALLWRESKDALLTFTEQSTVESAFLRVIDTKEKTE